MAEHSDEHSLSDSSDASGSEKTFSIRRELYDTLSSRGFSENAIKKSIAAGCINEATCTQWLSMHEGHPELDTPLEEGVVVNIKEKRILTDAEREAKVAELKSRIQQRKEEELTETRQKETQRIQMGRKAVEMKEQMEMVRRKLDVEEAQREKAEAENARKRIKIQLAADKLVRQGMTPDDARRKAEEEYAAAEEQIRAAARARLNAVPASSAPQPSAEPSSKWCLDGVLAPADPVEAFFDSPAPQEEDLPSIVAALRAQPEEVRGPCIQTLLVVLTNACAHPFDVKRRTLKTTTSTFKSKIAPVPDALRLLRWCLFDLTDDVDGMRAVRCSTLVVRRLASAIELLS